MVINVVKPSGRKRKDGSGHFSGNFVLVQFDDRDRADYGMWSAQGTFDISQDWPKLLEAGWKVSVSWSDAHECYYGSLTGRDERTGYVGHTFSVRHNDFDKLCRLLQYVSQVMLPDGRIGTNVPKDTEW